MKKKTCTDYNICPTPHDYHPRCETCNPTKVMFRKYKDTGVIFAIFPYEIWSYDNVTCYDWEGQHGPANYSWVLSDSKPANELEYRTLKEHLENDIGYNLKIIKKKMRK